MTKDWLETLSVMVRHCPVWLQIPLWLSCAAWNYGLYVVYKYPVWENLLEVIYWLIGNTVLFTVCYLVAKWRSKSAFDYTEHDAICAKIDEFNQRYAQAKRDRLSGVAARVNWERQQFMLTVVEDDNGVYSYKKAN